MSFFDTIFGAGGTLFSYVLPFLFVLTIVVFIHELGHFWIARLCGVRILTFSIGFGPELFGWHDRHGTRWRVAAVPLGGYVRFFGDEGVASTPDWEALARMDPKVRRESFFHQPLPNRAAIVAAGPLANFMLAILIFTSIFMFFGRPVTEARIDEVQADSPAERAGFLPGDVIISVNGQKIEGFFDLQRIVSINADTEIEAHVKRGSQELTLHATPEWREIKDSFGNPVRTGVLGIKRSETKSDVQVVRYGPLEAAEKGVTETWFVITRTLSYFNGIVSGRESVDQLSGPIRIAQVSGQAASIGFIALFNLAAVLSVSIGLLNLFPIPMLDGGHLLFYLIEGIRGRPLSERAQEMGFQIGIVVVLALMLVATWNDILHLTGLLS